MALPSFGTRLGNAGRALLGRPILSERRAGYDAARTTDENKKHWHEADDLAPTAQLTPDVRRTLRRRARYEVQNGCYPVRAVRVLCNDTIGTGARLQLRTDDAALNFEVESLWRLWSAAADFTLSQRVLYGCRVVAGEGFGVPRESKRLAALGLPVTLDVRLYEPDQIADPMGGWLATMGGGDDGIEVDEDGDPVAYKVLRVHPGAAVIGAGSVDTVRVPAADMYHWFVPDRPGQLRGVTPLNQALPVFAQLRRYTQATLTAAEVAAMMAGVLETNLGADDTTGGATIEAKAFDTVELVRGMMVTLPSGWRASQFKPEQPTTQYAAFVNAKLRECGAALNIPFGKMVGDHSSYNYSSGRLDDAPYWSDRDVERQGFEAKFLNPFLYRWLSMAVLSAPGLARWRGRWWAVPHAWQYDARPTSDPVKDGNADEINLTNGSDSLANIAARDGTTVESLIDQRKREKELFEAAGLPLPPWLAGVPAPVRTQDGPPAANQSEGGGNAA